jgi:hypothetical protein
MQRVVAIIRLRGEATPPEGEPPRVKVKGQSEDVTVEVAGAESAIARLLSGGVTYETDVTFSSETAFTETGRIAVGSGGDAVHISTVGEGFLGPSPDPGLLHGSVIWRIDGGEGVFEGASGLLTSNFVLAPDRGKVSEHQVATIFTP